MNESPKALSPPPEGLATIVQRMGPLQKGLPSGPRTPRRHGQLATARRGPRSRLDRLRSVLNQVLCSFVCCGVVQWVSCVFTELRRGEPTSNVFIYTEHTAREDLPNRPWNKVAHANSENTWHIHGSTFTVPYGTRMGACARGATGTTERTSERCTPPRGARACRAARASVRWQRPAAPSRGALRMALRA
jgi:hypothetical protein